MWEMGAGFCGVGLEILAVACGVSSSEIACPVALLYCISLGEGVCRVGGLGSGWVRQGTRDRRFVGVGQAGCCDCGLRLSSIWRRVSVSWHLMKESIFNVFPIFLVAIQLVFGVGALSPLCPFPGPLMTQPTVSK